MAILRAKRKLQMLKKQESDILPELIARIQAAQQTVSGKISLAARNPKAIAAAKARDDLYSRIGGVYGVLSNELDAVLQEALAKGAVDWHKAAVDDIKEFSGKVPTSVTRFDRQRIKDYWALISPDNAENLSAVFTKSMTKGAVKDLRAAFLDTWRQGELEGLTLVERKKILQQKWDTLAGDKAAYRFEDKSGRLWSNESYISMLVATTSARVARDSYFDTLNANGDDLVQITNADSEACDICQAWDGVILSISGTNKNYPSYNQALASGWGHPNDRCLADRVDETLDAAEIQKQADAPTPDFNQFAEIKNETERRRAITAAMHDYSKDFAFAPTVDPPTPIDLVAQKLDTAAAAIPLPTKKKDPEPGALQVESMRGEFQTAGFDQTVLEEVAKTPYVVASKISPLKGVTKLKADAAHYVPWEQKIEMNGDPTAWHGESSVFHHEFGHHVHEVLHLKSGQEISTAAAGARDTWKAQAKSAYGAGWSEAFSRTSAAHYKTMDDHVKTLGLAGNYFSLSNAEKHRVSGFFDTIMGITKGQLGWGHRVSYMKLPGYGNNEAFANVYRAIVKGWPEYEKAFPELWNFVKKVTGMP